MVENVGKTKLYSVLSAGVLCVSTGSIFARIADASPLVISAYRVGLAGVLLLPFAVALSKDEFKRLHLNDWLLGSIAGFFLALHFYTWISSLELTTVAASVVLVTTNPVWVGILSWIMGERTNYLTVAGIGLSFCGAVIIGWGDFLSGSHSILGDILALAGALCMTSYIMLGRTLRRKVSLLPYVTICYCSAGLFLWIAVFFTGSEFTGFSASTWTVFPAMAIVPQILGHSSCNWALRYATAPMVAVSLLGEPVLSSVLAWVILDEYITLPTFAGAAVIMSGIFLASRGEERLRRENI